MKNILFYSEDLAQVEYSPTHPFKPMRAKQMMDLLNRYGLLEDTQILEHPFLEEELLYLFHTPDYIQALKTCEHGEFDINLLTYGLGTHDNPIFKGVYSFSLQASGGTFLGAKKLVETDATFAFNPIGGFHHAMRDHAEGFCYINDLAIALHYLIKKGFKCAYIDIDVHHGDGVQSAFYDDNRVLTISIHESGQFLFPGTGFENEIGDGPGYGYNVNIPLLKDTDDEIYLYAFEEIVPPLLQSFKPDIVCIQVGGDSHKDDPLAHLNLTSNGYEKVLTLIKQYSGKVLGTGGGGYNLYKTSALWTLAWSTFAGIKPVDNFMGVVGGMMFGPEMDAGSLYDTPYHIGGLTKEQCFSYARDVVDYIKQTVFPIHKI
ncbi:MAG TPA: acetoin utilization protein AcuC [Spirochaetota bacterium]|nr:acetoin utilization protein AcuC [Spirochaetota bacterium]